MNYETEEEARRAVSLPPKDGVPGIDWKYLRFVKCTPNGDAVDSDSSFVIHPSSLASEWRPAAGTFKSWPRSTAAIRMLDPCMGSGHFLVFALPLLVRLRMEEEELSVQAAVVAVLKDNIHGLELDERCTQIAAFNVALTAWKLAGYQALPSLNMACSGLAPSATEAEWMALAGDNYRARNGMARLHRLFKDAPVLGSLINPRAQDRNLFVADFQELAPLLTAALAQSENQKAKFENDCVELAVIAQGLAKAAKLLAGQFTLVITNVPYLGRGKQDEVLKEYCERIHLEAAADLATCFAERCLAFCAPAGSTALVTPQNWLFLGSYRHLRAHLLKDRCWDLIVKLGGGAEAFNSGPGNITNVALFVLNQNAPSATQTFSGIDVSDSPTPTEKARALASSIVVKLSQAGQLSNPDARIVLTEPSSLPLLRTRAICVAGVLNGDSPRFIRTFWEIGCFGSDWEGLQSTVDATLYFGGRQQVIFWENGNGHLRRLAEDLKARLHDADKRGNQVWGKWGVTVSQMGKMPLTLYSGEKFDSNVAVISPEDARDLPAIWAFASSSDFQTAVRAVDQKLNVTNATLAKVPFHLAHWQKVAAEKYPDGLPKPHSDDPTQWLFYGHPNPLHPHGMLNRPSNADGSPFIIHNSSFILHVAMARLLGYRWPRQTGSSFPDCPALGPDGLESFADEDGIVCLPPLNREQPAAARLRQLLTAALGAFDERALIAAAGLKGNRSKTLEDWLRDEFFEQHVKLFHDRPFIWHLWDGRLDGFHAIVNYHRLDHAALQKLTYSYLGNWIQQQSDDAKADKPGAAERLGAARALQTKLAAILEGEALLDIFVRWKPIKDQAQGWHPDLNDGVRQNIRPFLLAGDVGKRGAGLFRTVPLKLKDKDRGTEPQRPKADYPWFWCEDEPGTDPTGGKDFVGNRWNDVHLTLKRKYEL